MLPTLYIGCASQPPALNPRQLDQDEDGFTPEDGDCDDRNVYANPSSGYNEPTAGCYLDVDGDGYGQPASPPYSAGTDCDDTDVFVHPGVEQHSMTSCMKDQDEDGYGVNITGKQHVSGGDCNDSDPQVHGASTDDWGILHCPSNAASPAHSIAQLTSQDVETFWGSTEDPPPKRLDGVGAQQIGLHYLTSNEGHPYLFYPKLHNLGGAYVGVGSDQSYLFISWQKPKLAWLSDYDPWIKQLHQLYHVFFLEAQTPQEFLQLWQPTQFVKVQHLLQKHHPNNRTLLVRYQRARIKVYKRLLYLQQTLQTHKTPSFLTDQASYNYIRTMIKARRIRPLQANLLEKQAFQGIGKASRQLKVPIRVIYLSNAEQYWSYSETFRRNMEALQSDQKALVLRTILTWKRNFDYAYIIQPFHKYVKWLRKPGVKRVYHITPKPTAPGKAPIYRFFDQ